jgi:triacylglycerol lipase
MFRLMVAVIVSLAFAAGCYAPQGTTAESDADASSLLFGSSSSTSCQTKYPIVLVHGLSFKDKNLLGINYWWGIPGELKKNGATVYVSNQDTFNGIAEAAQTLASELGVQFALHPTWKKVNLIAHSMGPLESRYMISNLSIPGKGAAKNYVASMSSISGTHRGSEIADVIWALYKGIPVIGEIGAAIISAGVNAFADIFYYAEGNQDCMKALYNLTTDYVKTVFNPSTPDASGVMYQSWGGKMNYIGTTPEQLMMGPTWLLMKAMGAGDNDGMVSIASSKWGTWRGAMTTSILYHGVSHLNEVGHLMGMTGGFDAPGFYVKVVKELKTKGY